MPRMTSFPIKPEFDPRADYEVAREFTCLATYYEPGAPFDKSKVTARLLRQLYELGKLTMVKEEEAAALAPIEKPVIRRKRLPLEVTEVV